MISLSPAPFSGVAAAFGASAPEAQAAATPTATIGLASALSSVLTVALIGIVALTVRHFRKRSNTKKHKAENLRAANFATYDSRSMGFSSIRSKLSNPASIGTLNSSVESIS